MVALKMKRSALDLARMPTATGSLWLVAIERRENPERRVLRGRKTEVLASSLLALRCESSAVAALLVGRGECPWKGMAVGAVGWSVLPPRVTLPPHASLFVAHFWRKRIWRASKLHFEVNVCDLLNGLLGGWVSVRERIGCIHVREGKGRSCQVPMIFA